VRPNYDVLVIGSGAAGLITALSLAGDGYSVLVASKDAVTNSSSAYAQGGIAVSLLETDSPEKHIQDTLEVGGELCDREVLEHYIGSIARHIETLASWGVPFLGYSQGSKVSDNNLAREGAHSERRVLRIGGDLSGKALMKVLWELVCRHPNISISQGTVLFDLLKNKNNQCIGGIFQDINYNCFPIISQETILASGGYSSVYAQSTNPIMSTGDGIAAAYRLGAQIRDMSLIQFHPTVLDHSSRFLLSEALRGEGARLVNDQGEYFMNRYDERLELAPRGVVSQAVWQESKNGQVYLDMHQVNSERFPGIYHRCQELGFRPETEAIPIITAAHYTIGGVAVNLQGQTTIPHLWAAGEASSTRLHGRDRLASNSLLECVVSAFDISEGISKSRDIISDFGISGFDEEFFGERVLDVSVDGDNDLTEQIHWLKQKMWDIASFGVKHDQVKSLLAKIADLQHQQTDNSDQQLKNMLLVDRLILEALLK